MLIEEGQGSAVIIIQSHNNTQECQGFPQWLSKEEVSQTVGETPHQQYKSLWEELSSYSISFQPFSPESPPPPNQNKRTKQQQQKSSQKTDPKKTPKTPNNK